MESYATAQEVFAGGLIFARLGAIVMLIPGLGEATIPPRVRLAFAFSMAVMLYPIIGPHVPSLPTTVSGVGGAVIKEVMLGLMLGAILRLFMTSLATAGEIISIQTTLSFAQTANPTQAQPTAIIGSFLSLLGVVLIMATNLHHMFLGAIVESYRMFPFDKALQVQDAGQLAIYTVGRSFSLGLQLAAPVVVFSLIFNIATGLVARVMPQFQVFFVATPLALMLGLSVFALSLGMLGVVWIDRYRSFLQVFS
jgi:flagellar biosynthetic protein FliR